MFCRTKKEKLKVEPKGRTEGYMRIQQETEDKRFSTGKGCDSERGREKKKNWEQGQRSKTRKQDERILNRKELELRRHEKVLSQTEHHFPTVAIKAKDTSVPIISISFAVWAHNHLWYPHKTHSFLPSVPAVLDQVSMMKALPEAPRESIK